MHNFLTLSRSRAWTIVLAITSVSVWMSSCIPICACVFFRQIVFQLGQLDNVNSGAKSLAAEIKQLCFVVMVDKILFKSRLPSRNWQKRGAEENRRRRELRVQYLLCLPWSQLTRTSLGSTWHAHFRHHWQTKAFTGLQLWAVDAGMRARFL